VLAVPAPVGPVPALDELASFDRVPLGDPAEELDIIEFDPGVDPTPATPPAPDEPEPPVVACAQTPALSVSAIALAAKNAFMMSSPIIDGRFSINLERGSQIAGSRPADGRPSSRRRQRLEFREHIGHLAVPGICLDAHYRRTLQHYALRRRPTGRWPKFCPRADAAITY
jgi:hypothetical protein